MWFQKFFPNKSITEIFIQIDISNFHYIYTLSLTNEIAKKKIDSRVIVGIDDARG